MKKSLLLLAGILIFAFTSCDKKHDHDGNVHVANPSSYITNVHAPTSGSDSITFTADSSQLTLRLFSPLGGTNMVIVHDLTTGNFLFRDTVSTIDKEVTGFTPGDNYSVVCYSGSSSPTNFSHVSSSYRNSGQTPSPFTGYTQYFNNSSTQGPSDGVVVIVLEEPTMGSRRK